MKEQEIRPKELFEEYLEISKNDIKAFFSDYDSFPRDFLTVSYNRKINKL